MHAPARLKCSKSRLLHLPLQLVTHLQFPAQILIVLKHSHQDLEVPAYVHKSWALSMQASSARAGASSLTALLTTGKQRAKSRRTHGTLQDYMYVQLTMCEQGEQCLGLAASV